LGEPGYDFVERGKLEGLVVVEVVEDFLEGSSFGGFELVVEHFVPDDVDDGSGIGLSRNVG
jgi:hypothetical protein